MRSDYRGNRVNICSGRKVEIFKQDGDKVEEEKVEEGHATNRIRPEFLLLMCYKDPKLRHYPKILPRIGECKNSPIGMLWRT